MQFPGILGRLRRKRIGTRRKNNLANIPVPTAPIQVIDASIDGPVITLEFNQAVKLAGVPQYTTDVVGAEVISVGAVTATKIAVTFSESVATATVLNIPFEDRAVRNSSGGFIMDSSFPLGAQAASTGERDVGQHGADGDDHVRRAA